MMISPSPPSHWLCRRRALARISSIPTSLESSTHSGAAGQALAGLEDLRPALLGDPPLAQLLALDPRLRGDEPLGQLGLRHLQREQRHGPSVLRRAAFSAMLHTSALLPIAGRAAMMIRLPGWKPPVISSRSLKPDGVPVSEVPFQRQPVQLVELLVQHLLDRAEVLLAVVAGDLEHRLLGLLDELARRRPVAEHALLDLVGALQQPAQQRVLAHDLRVAAGVPGGGHEARQLVHGGGTADLLELALWRRRSVTVSTSTGSLSLYSASIAS